MSKPVKTISFIIICSLLAILAVSTARAEEDLSEYHIAAPSAIIDLNAKEIVQSEKEVVKEVAVQIVDFQHSPIKEYLISTGLNIIPATKITPAQEAAEPVAIVEPITIPEPVEEAISTQPATKKPKENFFSDVTTTVNFDVNTSNPENKEINQADVSANLSANKGPFYVQYTHSRSYTKYSDPFMPEIKTDFEGTVNNRISFGINLTPDFSHNEIDPIVEEEIYQVNESTVTNSSVD